MEEDHLQPEPTRACGSCGAALPPTARVCPDCGGDASEQRRGTIVRGCFVLTSSLILVFISIGVGGYLVSRPHKAENERAAMESLRTIATVQARFRERDRTSVSSAIHYATSLAELSTAGLIDNFLGTGVKSGYAFGLSGTTFEWLATATPVDSSTGTRNFMVCTDGVVRFSTSAAPATCSSPAIQ